MFDPLGETNKPGSTVIRYLIAFVVGRKRWRRAVDAKTTAKRNCDFEPRRRSRIRKTKKKTMKTMRLTPKFNYLRNQLIYISIEI